MTIRKRTVLIADPEELIAALLSKLIDGSGEFTVCASVKDAYSAASAISDHKPDLMILAGELSGGGRAKFLKRLLPQYPIPVIAVTESSDEAAQLLSAGAADILPAPTGESLSAYREVLIRSLKNALNLRSVNCGGVDYVLLRSDTAAPEQPFRNDDRLILIGGSTGSTEALPIILKSLGSSAPPIAATLHMPGGYTAMYADRLSRELSLPAREAQDGMKLLPNTITIARGSSHLRITTDGASYLAQVSEGERISGHCPSVDALFLSAASLNASHIIAVLLTGMGSDGAIGMLKLRKKGAFTIGQDEKTSVVYGMPKTAYDIGAVAKQCPLESIADAIKQKLNEWK